MVSAFMAPLSAWNRLAWKAAEMAMDSAQVIGHRSYRIARSGPVPNARDRDEFALMGSEKVEIAVAVAHTAMLDLALLNQKYGLTLLKQMTAASMAVLSLSNSRNAGEVAERHARLVGDALTGSLLTAVKLSGSTARVARRALAPAHTRVRKNLLRLAGT
ncbi:polyhydroxyalkanoate granule-associated phasin [Uliginosibacterium sp. H1]|uniref:polyhydroxyalkanoate granule-associated phasin n=1 Tax=Uliginosibacterium sp. H1 TaxID=3114757 RepID=UPI002E195FA1|nr:polyhydroxyalkanoate granule-associated phasin [Uliginosibacterium sp. H1]